MSMRWIWMLTWTVLLCGCETETPSRALPDTHALPKNVMPTLPFDRARRLPRIDLRALQHWRQTLDASSYGFCRVRDGGVECWGGAFGAPRRIVGIDDALEVYTSAERGCAFRESERLTCWFPPGGALEGEGPVELPLLHHALPGAVDWEEQAGIGCAIDRAGVPSCFELCNDQSQCYRRFEPLPWPSLEVAVVSPSPLCSCALTREGELTCFGPVCEWWSGQEGAVALGSERRRRSARRRHELLRQGARRHPG